MYYNTGTRTGQSLQAHMRSGCSSFNADLYHNNIVLGPTCACRGIESAYHVFFVCCGFVHIRKKDLSDTLLNYTVKEFLYGNQNLFFSAKRTSWYFVKCKNT